MKLRKLHCWFDFEDGYWLDQDYVGGHTCMLEQDHDGPHQPTSDADITIYFNQPLAKPNGRRQP